MSFIMAPPKLKPKDGEEGVDPTIQLLVQMQETMQQQIKQQQEALQQQQERTQHQMERQQEALTVALNRLGDGAGGGNPNAQANGGGGNAQTRAKKIDLPHLTGPGSTTLADFRDWRERFQGYVRVQKLQTDCDRDARRDIMRLALDAEWTKLWTTGVLQIQANDDINEILQHLSTYLRRLRNPLLDRKDFYERKQAVTQKVDQFYAALQIIYDSCGWNDNPNCSMCNAPCGHGQALRNERLRDRIICGLHDETMQQKVFERDIDALTLDETLRICRAQEASKDTQGRLSSDFSNSLNIGATQRST